MPAAYVLLNTEIGAEASVLKALRSVEGVQEAFSLWGIYDIIARVKADSMEKLTSILSEKFQISNIHSRLTVIITES